MEGYRLCRLPPRGAETRTQRRTRRGQCRCQPHSGCSEDWTACGGDARACRPVVGSRLGLRWAKGEDSGRTQPGQHCGCARGGVVGGARKTEETAQEDEIGHFMSSTSPLSSLRRPCAVFTSARKIACEASS